MKLLATVFVALLTGLSAFAFDTQVKGFLALDLMNVRAIEYQRAAPDVTAGVGAFDLKFFAEQERLTLKIKLDLDGTELNYYNIFEEVTARYRLTDMVSFEAGKGVIYFHQKHWGVLEASYYDSGSILGANNSWRDQDNKLLTVINFGSYQQRFINHFTFYGSSSAPNRNPDGTLIYNTDGTKKYFNQKSFRSKYERGFADQIEFFPTKELSLAIGGVHYWSQVNPQRSWALDTNGEYKSDLWQFWWEYLYGFTSQDEDAASYARPLQWEQVAQIGAEYSINELYSALLDIEGCWAHGAEYPHKITANGKTTIDANRRGQSSKVTNYKVDLGTKIKLYPSAFMTLGVAGELKNMRESDRPDKTIRAAEAAAKLSWWF
ncbi:MAG: hypothetical protein WCG27_07105 [Pseudomonadota bacterium]